MPTIELTPPTPYPQYPAGAAIWTPIRALEGNFAEISMTFQVQHNLFEDDDLVVCPFPSGFNVVLGAGVYFKAPGA